MPRPRQPRVALVAPFAPPPAGMTLQAQMLADLLERDGAVVTRVNTNPLGRRKPRTIRFLIVLRDLPRIRGADLALIFAGSFNSFFAFSLVPLLAARLYRVPALIMYKGGLAEEFFRRWGWLVRPSVRLSRGVVVPGRFLAGVFARHGMSAHVVPDVIASGSLPARAARGDGPPTLFNPRRHVPVCGVLIRAFDDVLAAFPGAELHLCGDGTERPALEKLAAARGGGRVKFHGFIPHKDLEPFYERATLMVNSNRDDNHPNSVLEAMAAGLPVVATAVGGVPYLIEDGKTGFLVPSDDAAALAAKIIYVLRNPDVAAAAAARAREAVAEFIWPYERAGHLEVVWKLAGLPVDRLDAQER